MKNAHNSNRFHLLIRRSWSANNLEFKLNYFQSTTTVRPRLAALIDSLIDEMISVKLYLTTTAVEIARRPVERDLTANWSVHTSVELYQSRCRLDRGRSLRTARPVWIELKSGRGNSERVTWHTFSRFFGPSKSRKPTLPFHPSSAFDCITHATGLLSFA